MGQKETPTRNQFGWCILFIYLFFLSGGGWYFVHRQTHIIRHCQTQTNTSCYTSITRKGAQQSWRVLDFLVTCCQNFEHLPVAAKEKMSLLYRFILFNSLMWSSWRSFMNCSPVLCSVLWGCWRPIWGKCYQLHKMTSHILFMYNI